MLKKILKAKTLLITLVIALSINVSQASAANITWIDWSPASTSGFTTGLMNFGASTVDTTLNGNFFSIDGGNSYYNNSHTMRSNTYGNFAPHDTIRISNAGNLTINLSKAIVNPYIAMVSVGQDSKPVSYTFNNVAPDALSFITYGTNGDNIWGATESWSITNNTFSGREFNGILQLTGTYNQISIDIGNNEYWHGFNIGSEAPTPAPEPSSMLLGLASIAGLASRRRK